MTFIFSDGSEGYASISELDFFSLLSASKRGVAEISIPIRYNGNMISVNIRHLEPKSANVVFDVFSAG